MGVLGMTDRMQWLNDRLNEAYDVEYFETDDLSIECQMVFGYKGERTTRAVITWREPRDENVDLAGALDKAIQRTTRGAS